MGRAPCCSKVGLHRGPWTPREDTILSKFIETHGEGHWRSLPKNAGLLRCGKSCRLRWMNYLRPNIKRGNISSDEDDLIIRLHTLLGNRWSLIAGRLPGRTDNEIKNYWNTHLSKRLRRLGIDPNTHKKLSDVQQQLQVKKRTKNNKNKNERKRKSSSAHSNPKLHLPKPIRVTTSISIPKSESVERNHTISIASSRNHSQDDDANGGFVTWDNPNGITFFDGNEIVKEPDFECKTDVPASDHHRSDLEKIYEEYLELLSKDEDQIQSTHETFTESLFI